MKIVIVDDDILVSSALKTILEAGGEVEVTGTGQDGKDAVRLYDELLPDVLLMDIRMKDMNGLDAAEQILKRHTDAKILLLTTFSDDAYIVKALKYGVKGYLIKQDYGSILPALQAVQMNQTVFGTEIMSRIPGLLQKEKKEKEQRSVLEEEQMQSPFRTIIKNLLENKLAMGGLIVFVSIFAMCFILPIWFHQDLNYQDPTQKNIAPGFSFLSVPSDLKDNAEVIEFGPTYGVGVDKDGYVYEWGQLTKNLKKIPADMGKVVDIAVGQDHVLAINDKGNLYTWGFNRMGLNVIPPELKGKKIADIEAGYQVSVVVTEDGKVVSWGNTSAVDISTANVKDEKVKEVKANIQTAIALTKDGKVISLAKKETALDNVPEEIQGKVEKIALTDKAAAAVLKDGTVKVWGNNHDHIFSVPEEVQGKAVDI